jgi:hypothetical protein
LVADLKAATAQTQKADLAEQAQQLDQAVALWSQAVSLCTGRAQERAQRNLADSVKVRASVQEQLGSGPQCAAAHKDAGSFQNMARQALAEQRWDEAARLYRKAEDWWDLASERCSGSQQQAALRHRAEAQIDSHNAAHCAPAFAQARDQTQRLRNLAPGLSRDEKQEASQMVETLWHDTLGWCKGQALETARSQMQTIARERGTPWVATRSAAALPPLPTAATVAPAPSATTPAPQNPALAASAAAAASIPASTTATAPLEPSANPAPSAAPSPSQPEAQAGDFSSGTTRFSGRFVRDASGTTYSGTGRILWANGDMYDGSLVQGQRHGKGQFVWANGQRYNGDWVRDQPSGQASIQFANGNLYDGTVVNGTPQGQGRMLYASGDHYVGQFKAGLPEGSGIQTWKNGQRYDGTWQNARPHGSGRMQFASGDVYLGQLANGLPEGQGTFTWANGDQYVGPWKAGKKHGQGVFTWKNGDRWEGLYDNDQQTAQGDLIRK